MYKRNKGIIQDIVVIYHKYGGTGITNNGVRLVLLKVLPPVCMNLKVMLVQVQIVLSVEHF